MSESETITVPIHAELSAVGASTEVLRVQAGDTVVIKMPESASKAQAQMIHDAVKKCLPEGVKCLILIGCEVGVMRPA